MQKKILLFGVGLIVVSGGFAAYSYLTGSSLMMRRSGGILADAQNVPVDPKADINNPNFESRDKTDMRLEYVLTARIARPLGKGHYDLIEPRATYYGKDGTLAVVTADTGMIEVEQIGGRGGSLGGNVDQMGGKQQQITLKGGKLSKNVLLTVGPQDSFVVNSTALQPRQIQAQFENDIDFNYGDHTLESKGRIRVRGDKIAFDGRNMTMLFNNEQKRIEYLRIDPGEGGGKITLHDMQTEGDDALGLSPATQAVAATPSPGADTPPAAVPGQKPAPTGAQPPPTAVAKADPAKPAQAPTAYQLTFKKDVKAVIGDRTLISDEMHVFFAAAARDAARPPTTPTTLAAPGGQAPPVESTPTAAPAARVAAPDSSNATPPPATAPQSQDLVITWTDAMELTPAGPVENKLTGPKDRIFQASSHQGRPVLMTIGDTQRLVSGSVWYQTSTRQTRLEAGELAEVELDDTKMGKLFCKALIADTLNNSLEMIGPGHLEMLAGALDQDVNNPANATNKQPITAGWAESLAITLARVPDARKPGKMDSIIRRAVFTGNADIHDPASGWIHGNVIDALVAYAPQGDNGRPQQGIEHLLATGNVKTDSYGGAGQARQLADSIEGQRLELSTAMMAGRALPQPAELVVDGQVRAITYQPDNGDKTRLLKSQIETPKLVARLEPKAAPGTAGAEGGTAAQGDGLRGISPKEMEATGGVRIEMDLAGGNDHVVATADHLFANAKANTAVLYGTSTPTAVPAKLQRGQDSIIGMEIHLDRTTQSIEIPGPGQFTFYQEAKKVEGKPQETYPVEVTWADHMNYNGKLRKGEFIGDIHAALVNKPDQTSKLTSDKLFVTLAASAGGTDITSQAGTKGLADLTAEGNVYAYGATFDPQHNLLTSMELSKAASLTYDEANKMLRVPGSGELVLTDHRPKTPGKEPVAAASRTGPLTNPNGMRGVSGFVWQDGLTYSGNTAEIHLKKNVTMGHVPEEPMRAIPATDVKNKSGVPGKPDSLSTVQLICDDLVATLDNPKNQTNNPVALGLNENAKVSHVKAQGVGEYPARLTVVSPDGTRMLLADQLDFDALKNQAVATGKGRSPAQAQTPDQSGIMNADVITWDMTKDPTKKDEAFTLTRPRISQ